MNKMFKKILAVAAVAATAACMSVSAFAADVTVAPENASVSVNAATVEGATQYTVMLFKTDVEFAAADADEETIAAAEKAIAAATPASVADIYYINQGSELVNDEGTGLVQDMLVKATTVTNADETTTTTYLPTGNYIVRVGNSTGSVENIQLTVGEETVTIVYGDVNDDGEVTRKDKTLLIKYLLDPENIVINKAASDVNSDGDVTRKDKTLLIKYLLDPENVVIPSK